MLRHGPDTFLREKISGMSFYLQMQPAVARDAASKNAKTVRTASDGRSSAGPDAPSSSSNELEAALEKDELRMYLLTWNNREPIRIKSMKNDYFTRT